MRRARPLRAPQTVSVAQSAFLAGIPGLGYATQRTLPSGLQECRGSFSPDPSREHELTAHIVMALEPVVFAGVVYTDVGERRATFPVIASMTVTATESNQRAVVRFVATGNPFASTDAT